MTNLIDLTCLAPNSNFSAIFKLISSLVFELFVTHNIEGIKQFWSKLIFLNYKTNIKIKFDTDITWQIKSTFNSKPKKERFFQFVDFFFFETTKPCPFPPIFVCDLITSFYAWLSPKSNWSLCLRSETRCYAQNTFSIKILDFLFIDTTKLFFLFALNVVLFDETCQTWLTCHIKCPNHPLVQFWC